MSSFSCPHQVNEICLRVDGAYCRPGMRGCVLCGKVVFEDGIIPAPRWPSGEEDGEVLPDRSLPPQA